MSESPSPRPARRRVEHPLFAPLIACVLHGIGLASLAFVHVATSATVESNDEEVASFTLDLRGSPLIVSEESEPESAHDAPPQTVTEVAEPPLEVPPAPEPEPIAPVLEVPPEPPPEVFVEPEPPVPDPPTPALIRPVPAAAPDVPATPFLETGAGAPVHAHPDGHVVDGSDAVPPPPVPAGPPPPKTPASPAPASGPAPGATPAKGRDSDALVDAKTLRARSTPRPEYPSAAKQRGEQGSVVCRLTIDREGHVIQVEVVTSSGFKDLDESAVRALERWRFEPLDRSIKGDRVRALQRLTFELSRAGR